MADLVLNLTLPIAKNQITPTENCQGNFEDESAQMQFSQEELDELLLQQRQELTAEFKAKLDEKIIEHKASTDFALAEYNNARQAILQTIAKLEMFQSEIQTELQQVSVKLALAITGKILAKKIERDEIEIDPILKDSLSKIPHAKQASIYLNPEDLSKSELAKDSAPGLEFLPDPKLQKGSCEIRTEYGSVASSLQNSINKVTDTLAGESQL